MKKDLQEERERISHLIRETVGKDGKEWDELCRSWDWESEKGMGRNFLR